MEDKDFSFLFYLILSQAFDPIVNLLTHVARLWCRSSLPHATQTTTDSLSACQRAYGVEDVNTVMMKFPKMICRRSSSRKRECFQLSGLGILRLMDSESRNKWRREQK